MQHLSHVLTGRHGGSRAWLAATPWQFSLLLELDQVSLAHQCCALLQTQAFVAHETMPWAQQFTCGGCEERVRDEGPALRWRTFDSPRFQRLITHTRTLDPLSAVLVEAELLEDLRELSETLQNGIFDLLPDAVKD